MARDKVCVVIGAGDATGGAIARRFAREGYLVFAGRRNGDGEGTDPVPSPSFRSLAA